MLFLKFYLRFSRVYIDVYRSRIYLQIDKVFRLLRRLYKSLVSRCNSVVQILILYKTMIYQQKLQILIFCQKIRLHYKTADTHHIGIFGNNRHQFLISFIAKQMHYTLPKISRRQVKQFTSIVVKVEMYGRVSQSHPLKFI